MSASSFFSWMQKFLFLFGGWIFLCFLFSSSAFAAVWNDTGSKTNSGTTLSVLPNQTITFGAGADTGNNMVIIGFTGSYSNVINGSPLTFTIDPDTGTSLNHYIQSTTSVRLKKISTRSGYFSEGGTANKDGCTTSANYLSGKTYYCFHAQVEAVCTFPSGYTKTGGTNPQYVFQGETIATTQNGFASGAKIINLSCNSSGVVQYSTPSISCGAGYYLSNNFCMRVETGKYSAAGSNTQTSCTNKPSNNAVYISHTLSPFTGGANNCPWECSPNWYGNTCTTAGTRTCQNPPTNSTGGIEIWNGSTWNTCSGFSCNSGYYVSENSCRAYTYDWINTDWEAGTLESSCFPAGINTDGSTQYKKAKKVYCQRNDGIMVAESFCPSSSRPAYFESCTTSSISAILSGGYYCAKKYDSYSIGSSDIGWGCGPALGTTGSTWQRWGNACEKSDVLGQIGSDTTGNLLAYWCRKKGNIFQNTISEPTQNKFNHVLYGAGSLPNAIIENIDTTLNIYKVQIATILGTSWQQYLYTDGTSNGTTFFVYPEKPRYALITQKEDGVFVGYKIFKVELNADLTVKKTNIGAVCAIGWQKKQNEDGTEFFCEKSEIKLKIENNGSTLTAQSGQEFYIKTKAWNEGNAIAQNPYITFSYDTSAMEFLPSAGCSSPTLGTVRCTTATLSSGSPINYWNLDINFRAKKAGKYTLTPVIYDGAANKYTQFSHEITISAATISLSASSVEENKTGTVGTLSIPSVSGVSYSICSASSPFSVTGTNGNILTLNTAQNYETMKTLPVCIQAKIGGVEIGKKDFTVNISDVNEAPTANDKTVNVEQLKSITITLPDATLGTDPDSSSPFSNIVLVRTNLSGEAANGTIALSNDKKSLTYTNTNGNIGGTDYVGYKICDHGNDGSAAMKCSDPKKIYFTIIAAAGSCSFDGVNVMNGNKGEFWDKTDKLCLFQQSFTCNSGTFSPALSTTTHSKECTPNVSNIFSITEKETALNNSNFENPFQTTLGKALVLQPQVQTTNFFPTTGKIEKLKVEISFEKSKFEKNSTNTTNTEWTCTDDGTMGTKCSQNFIMTQRPTELQLPLITKLKSNSEKIEYKIYYNEVLISPTKEVYVEIQAHTLLRNVLTVVENAIGKTASPFLDIADETGEIFTLTDDANCTTPNPILPSAKENFVFDTVDKKTLKITKKLEKSSSFICVQAKSATGNFLGNFPVIINATQPADFFVDFAQGEYEENINGLVIGKIVGNSSFSGIPVLVGTSANMFEIVQNNTVSDSTNTQKTSFLNEISAQNTTSTINAFLERNVSQKSMKKYFSILLEKDGILKTQERVTQWKQFITSSNDSSAGTSSYILKLKNNTAFDFENLGLEKMVEVQIKAQMGTTDVENKFFVPVKDMNDAPKEIGEKSIDIPSETKKVFQKSDFGMNDATDPDEIDGLGNLSFSVLALNGDIIDKDSSDTKIITENFSIEITNNGDTITAEGSDSNAVISVKICDDNSPNGEASLSDFPPGKQQCSVSTVSFIFGTPNNCTALTISNGLILPETLHEKIAGNFYTTENDDSCTAKQIKCSNGSFYFADAMTTKITSDSSIFASCKKQCTGKNGNIINDGVKENFFSKASMPNCPATGDLELTCQNGIWMNGGTPVSSPIMECNKSCTYKTEHIDHGKEISFYKNSVYQSPTLCSENTQKLICDTGKWKLNNIEKTIGTDFFAECRDETTISQCEILIDGGNSVFLNENAKPEKDLFIQKDAPKCIPAKVECTNGKILKVNGEIFPSTQKLFISCGKQCLYPKPKDEDEKLTYKPSGSLELLAIEQAGKCSMEQLECQNGQWKWEERWIKAPSLLCNNKNEEDSSDDDREIVIDIIDNKKETGVDFKIFNHPLNNIKDATIKSLDLRKEPAFAYDAKKTSNHTDKNFISPFQENGSQAKMSVKIRFYPKNKDLSLLKGYNINSETYDPQMTVLRWKISAKDKNGDPITLLPAYKYTQEDAECPETMLCIKDIENTPIDPTNKYAEINFSNFRGKIFSKSLDEEIQLAIINLAEKREDGEVDYLDFLRSEELGISFPSFEILPEIRLSNAHMTYKLEITDLPEEGKYALSDGKFRIESLGTYNGTQQKISTIVEQGKLLPVFNYVIFGE